MGKRSTFDRIPRDFYPTPPEAVYPLLPHIERGTTYAEPCAGNLALYQPLAAHGITCVFSGDIEPQHPAVIQFDALSDDLDSVVANADYIITNPPWSRDVLHPMIRRFASLRPTWLLFDADWMHTRQSAEFMPLLRKVVSVGRLRWIPGTTMTGKDNCAWYLFDACNPGPTLFVGRSA